MVNHRRERCRLAATCGADHQYQTTSQHDEIFQLPWHAEFVERRQFRGDVAQHHGDIAALMKYVDPESTKARLRDREVDLEFACERLELVFIHEFHRRLLDHLRRHLQLVHRHDLAVNLDLRWRERRKEKVRSLFLDHQLE